MMTKSDIMSNTLDQLIDKFSAEPDSFKYLENGLYESVMWTIPDPVSYQRSVIVAWSDLDKSLSLFIFNEKFDSISTFQNTPRLYDAKLELRRPFEKWRKNRRKFDTLVNLIKTQEEHNKNKEFINKISSVFPTILDHFILGK